MSKKYLIKLTFQSGYVSDEIISGNHMKFPLCIWQTGSGTQANMNLKRSNFLMSSC